MKHLLKIYSLCIFLCVGCHCSTNPEISTTPSHIPSQSYHNLEIIKLGIKGSDSFSFEFNGKKLVSKDNVYLSEDLIVYQTQANEWHATVIGPGEVSSKLKISNPKGVVQEVDITTTNKVFAYQDEIGPEWPGMQNIGSTCFSNSVYKLIARCSGYDTELSKDSVEGIHTYLRNIVNGIRLGKKSALQEKSVNRKVSELFLDRLGQLGKWEKYNDKQQHDAATFLLEIQKLLYPTEIEHASPTEIKKIIADQATRRHPFEYAVNQATITGGKQNDNFTYTFHYVHRLPTSQGSIVHRYYLSLPYFFMYKLSTTNESKKDLPNPLEVPWWDFEKN